MGVDRPPAGIRACFLHGIGLEGLVDESANLLEGSNRIVDEGLVPNRKQVSVARVQPRKHAGRRGRPPFGEGAHIEVRPAARRIYCGTPAVGAEDVDGVAVNV